MNTPFSLGGQEQNVQEEFLSTAAWVEVTLEPVGEPAGGQPYVRHNETTAATFPKGLQLPVQSPQLILILLWTACLTDEKNCAGEFVLHVSVSNVL